MEGSGGGSVGPSNTHSHSRPVRTSSRYFYGHHNSSSPATFCGPVRRWEKKWVHVSSSQPSNTSTKPRKNFLSNGSNSPNSPILLCKWTPLSRPPSTATTTDIVTVEDDSNSGHLSRRKFRYTPITVFEEKKKLIAKGVMDEHKSGEANQSKERSEMDNDDIYGLLDINSDFMGARQRTSEGDLTYSRRSHLNLGLYLENNDKDGQSDMNVRRFWMN